MSDTDDLASSHSVEPVQLFGSEVTPTQQSASVENPQIRSNATSQSATRGPKQPFSKSLIRKRKTVMSSSSSDSTISTPPTEDRTMDEEPRTNDDKEAPPAQQEQQPAEGDSHSSEAASVVTQPQPPPDNINVLIENLQMVTAGSDNNSTEQDEQTALSIGENVHENPKSEYQLQNGYPGSVGRDNKEDSIHAHAKRALVNLLFRRTPDKVCYKQTDRSHKTKKCLCVGEQLCRPIQDDYVNAGGDLDFFNHDDDTHEKALSVVKKKWLPVLRRLLAVSKPIAMECLSEDVFGGFLSQVDPTSEDQRSNAPKYILDTGVKFGDDAHTFKLHLCFTAFEEVMGRHPWRTAFFQFQYKFCSGTEGASAAKSPTKTPPKKKHKAETPPSEKTPSKVKMPHFPPKPDLSKEDGDSQSYIRHYAKPKSLRSWTYGHITSTAIERRFFPGFTAKGDIGKKDEDKMSGQKTLALARDIGINANDNYVEATFSKVRDAIVGLLDQQLYVIAHPDMKCLKTLAASSSTKNPRSIKRAVVFKVEGSESCSAPMEREEGVEDCLTLHSGNAGVIDASIYKEAFDCLYKSVMSFAGANCHKKGADGEHVVPDVFGCNNLRYLGTDPVKDDHASNPFPQFLDSIGMKNASVRDKLLPILANFVDDLFEACHDLLPRSRQTKFQLVMMAGYMESVIADFGKHILSLQLSHMDFDRLFLNELLRLGIRIFVATHSLTDEGAHLRVHESWDDEDEDTLKGKVVFIPGGNVFIQPATMIHAGGFRTGKLGNPRMHYVLFLVPADLHEQDWKPRITATFTQTYFGVEEKDCHSFQVVDGRVNRADIVDRATKVVLKPAGIFKFPAKTGRTHKAYREECANHIFQFVDALGL